MESCVESTFSDKVWSEGIPLQLQCNPLVFNLVILKIYTNHYTNILLVQIRTSGISLIINVGNIIHDSNLFEIFELILVIKLTPLIVLLTACGHIKQLGIHHII